MIGEQAPGRRGVYTRGAPIGHFYPKLSSPAPFLAALFSPLFIRHVMSHGRRMRSDSDLRLFYSSPGDDGSLS